MSSIKKNFFYSSILTTSNYIFPFLTYPYVSRILGVANIGICNFVDSIINYFIIFSMMGIGIIGIREIAKTKNDKRALNETFSSLFTLNTISTSIALLILLICIITVPKLYEHKDLMCIGVIKLISNFLLIEWLYKGLEEFKYITIRTIIIKFIYVISVFVFIREANDYNIYFLLTTLMITFNSILNCLHARKYIHFHRINIKLTPYLKPFIILGVYTLLTSMYTSFNVAYLGFVSGDTEVGYYTTATKIYSILLAVFTAFTGVMLPRMSSLLGEGKTEEFYSLIKKSISGLIAFAFPVIIIAEFFAPEIIYIISGLGYEGSIIPMRIIMPLIFIIGYEQIIIIQALMPLKKDKAIFFNSIIGALLGIILNITLVARFNSIGSSMVWLNSEIAVLISAQYFIKKYTNTISFPFKEILKNIIWAIPIISIVYFISQVASIPSFFKLVFGTIITTIYYYIIQIRVLKNEIIISINNKMLQHKK